MSQLLEVRMPKYPECWESCGNCAAGEVIIESLLVAPGDIIECDATILVLETGKVALDIQTPHAGTVVEIFVEEGQHVAEGALVMSIEPL